MFSQVYLFKTDRRIALSLILALIWGATTVAKGGSPSEPGPDVSKTERSYDRIISEDRQSRRKNQIIEDAASGVAAIVIGMYGYYFDNRGFLAKLVYSATSTAGVYVISDAVFRANQPSLLLSIDEQLRKDKAIDRKDYQLLVVRDHDRLTIAEHKRNAYAGTVLAAMYLYNGTKEKEIKSLSNVFYFLGFNFVLVSAASFYKVFSYDAQKSWGYNSEARTPSLRVSVLPFPGIDVTF